MTVASNNEFPSLLIKEGTAPASPAAGDQRLFIDSADHALKVKNSGGTVTAVGGAGGAVATDAIWDAAGDLAVGTGADTAAKLTKGADSTVLTMSASTHLPVWAAPAASAVVPWAIVPEGGGIATTTRATGASNRAIYVPCTIPVACTLTGIRLNVNTQSGNICVGLYDSAGNRVATSGSVACPANGSQSVAFTGNYSAAAGRYYLAVSLDNNTATIGWVQDITSGIASPLSGLYQASAFPLPTTIASAGTIGCPALIGTISGGTP